MKGAKKLEHAILAITTMVWGGVLIYLYQHERLSSYLSEKFHLYVLIGGLVALIVGLFNLLTINQKADCGHDHDHDDVGCGHDHDHDHDHDDHEHASEMNPFVAMILIAMPLFYSLSVTTHGFSDDYQEAISAKDVDASNFTFVEIPPLTRETLEKTRTKSSDGAFQLHLAELFSTAGDSEAEKVFNDLYVETEGKLRNEPNRNESRKRMRIYRLYMNCCAADARVIPISIEFDGELPDIAHKEWVRVAGKMHYERIKGVVYPVLKVTKIQQIPVPEGEWSEGMMDY